MLKNYRVWKVKYKASRYSLKLALLQIKRNHNFFLIRLIESLLRVENFFLNLKSITMENGKINLEMDRSLSKI